jgi:flagellar biogenesis protein FliO
MKVLLGLAFFCVYVSVVPVSIADEKGNVINTTEVQASIPTLLGDAPSSSGTSLFRMFGGLLFCLGVFGAGIHLSRRYGFAQPKGSKRRMKVIEKMQLTQKSSLLLVSCDGRELLLSVGPDQARVLQSQLSSSREFFEETFADMYSSEDEEKRCVA